MSGSPPPTILAFLKAPVAGAVKTRLAAAIGDQQALDVYRQLVESQLKRLPANWSREIHYSPPTKLDMMRQWLGSDEAYFPQASGDLGERLKRGLARAFTRGAPVACAIGGDCPGLEPRHFEEARSVLASAAADVVFGPAEDGGYTLVALRQPMPEIFHNIPWSCETTLECSITAARKIGKKIHLLPVLADVDTLDDLQRIFKD